MTEPSLDALPFWVRHGDLIGPVVIAVAAIGAGVIARRRGVTAALTIAAGAAVLTGALLLVLGRTLPADLSITAAFPGGRSRVLDDTERRLERSGPTTERDLALLAGIAGDRRGCAAAVRALADHGQIEDALAHGDRCPDPARAIELLLQLGRYGDAADLARANAVTTDGAMLAFLATDAWPDAAAIASERHRDCLAAALRTRADATATGELRERSADDTTCAILLADLLDGDRRIEILGPISRDDSAPPELVALAGEGLVLDGYIARWTRGPVAADIVNLTATPPLALRSVYAGNRGGLFNNDDTKPRAAAGAAAFAWIAGDAARVHDHLDHAEPWIEGVAARDLRAQIAGDIARLRAAFDRRMNSHTPANPYRHRDPVALAPAALAWRAATERDLAADATTAAAWQAVATRHLAMLADPQRALLLEVWALPER